MVKCQRRGMVNGRGTSAEEGPFGCQVGGGMFIVSVLGLLELNVCSIEIYAKRVVLGGTYLITLKGESDREFGRCWEGEGG